MLRRVAPAALAVSKADELPDVTATIEDVRSGGDAAIARAAASYGDPAPRRFDAEGLNEARLSLDTGLAGALERAAARIAAFAALQRASLLECHSNACGFELVAMAYPVQSVGVYVPSGRYPLVSSLLMGVVPARAAGVESVIVCTPRANQTILAAASIAGADGVHQIGGAQAIAAMAYGTESIARVDTIVGPGNRYVTAAKRAVAGACGIDALAGPSEVVIIASGDADARLVAADLLAQAEHDLAAHTVLLTDDPMFADAVDAELVHQLSELATEGIAHGSIVRNGRCAVLPLGQAIALANTLAPEHLELHGANAESLAPRATCFGALFVGSGAGETFGDYGAGANHILPTAGTARFSGGLSVFTFLNIRTTLRSIGPIDAGIIADSATLAEAEGLHAHARAARLRADGCLAPAARNSDTGAA